MKMCIRDRNTAEDGDGYAGYNNSFLAGTQPDNKKWSKCGFWQAVQNHQVGLQDSGDFWEKP